VERSCGLTNSNRIRGSYDRTSGLPTTKSITIKGHGGISDERAAKAVELTPGGLRCRLEIGAERVARLAELSAEVSRGLNRRDYSAEGPNGWKILPHRPGRCISFPDRFDGLDAPISARVAMYETAIDREAAGHEASLAALLDNLLKQHAVDVARDKPAMAVLGEGRMIRTAPSNPSRQNQR
jgi:hypothetical protein